MLLALRTCAGKLGGLSLWPECLVCLAKMQQREGREDCGGEKSEEIGEQVAVDVEEHIAPVTSQCVGEEGS